MLTPVKAARARIVKGKIVTRAKFPEGARLTILVDDDRPPIELEPEDEEAMLRGVESIKAGNGVRLDAFRAMHDRLLRAYFVESRDITKTDTLRTLWREIGFEEIKRRETLGLRPLNLAKDPILDFTFISANQKEP